jgi:hypothetical protein
VSRLGKKVSQGERAFEREAERRRMHPASPKALPRVRKGGRQSPDLLVDVDPPQPGTRGGAER